MTSMTGPRTRSLLVLTNSDLRLGGDDWVDYYSLFN